MVLMVYGPRSLGVDDRLETTGRTQTGIRIQNEEVESAHLECRGGAEGDVPVATATVPVVVTPVKSGAPARPGDVSDKHWYQALTAPTADLPKLVPYKGALPEGGVKNAGAIAFYPKGNPFLYADTYSSQTNEGDASVGVSLRFWMRKPSNLSGIVFRVVEQALVPDEDPAAYAIAFPERVAAVDRRSRELQPEMAEQVKAHAEYCKTHDVADCLDYHRTSMGIPPAPLAEMRPKQPRGDVDWVPGYWNWDDSLGDFLWIAGTYVVRAAKPVQVADVATPAPTPPPPPPPVLVVAEPPREIDAKIEEAPAPKVEVLPPPPPVPQPNTVWVAGHWELVGSAWHWTTGAWIVAPVGTRYRAPVIHRRGTIRIYVPGGWRR